MVYYETVILKYMIYYISCLNWTYLKTIAYSFNEMSVVCYF